MRSIGRELLIAALATAIVGKSHLLGSAHRQWATDGILQAPLS